MHSDIGACMRVCETAPHQQTDSRYHSPMRHIILKAVLLLGAFYMPIPIIAYVASHSALDSCVPVMQSELETAMLAGQRRLGATSLRALAPLHLVTHPADYSR